MRIAPLTFLSFAYCLPEMGGFYFCFNSLLNQLSCWVAAYLYNKYYDGEEKIPSFLIYSFLAILLVLWSMSLILFFGKINKEYWSTFYSTETGCENAKSYFTSNTDDAKRATIFLRSIDLWNSIEEQVKEWTISNWSKWDEEKPEWFSSRVKSSVPLHLIPAENLF